MELVEGKWLDPGIVSAREKVSEELERLKAECEHMCENMYAVAEFGPIAGANKNAFIPEAYDGHIIKVKTEDIKLQQHTDTVYGAIELTCAITFELPDSMKDTQKTYAIYKITIFKSSDDDSDDAAIYQGKPGSNIYCSTSMSACTLYIRLMI